MNRNTIEKKIILLFGSVTIGGYEIRFPWSPRGEYNDIEGIAVRVQRVLDWFVAFSAILAVGFIVYSGIQFMTSAGDADKMASARKMLTAAVVGMIIVFLSRVILQFFVNTFLQP